MNELVQTIASIRNTYPRGTGEVGVVFVRSFLRRVSTRASVTISKAKTPYTSWSRGIRGLQVPQDKRRHYHQQKAGSIKLDLPPTEVFHYSMDSRPD
jgi:hypothetical protein